MSGQSSFTNMVRILYNIDSFLLPELTSEQQSEFIANPHRYFVNADKAQQDAIYREIGKRQKAAPLLDQIEALWHSTAAAISFHHADDSGKEWGQANAFKPLLIELESQIKRRGGDRPDGSKYLLGHGFRIGWPTEPAPTAAA